MAILPERVWSKKSPVFHKKKAVWKKGSKLGVYDPQFKEVSSGEIYPSDKWEDVGQNDELQIYESLEKTDIGTFKDGLVATYTFKDRDGTVLKTGTVKDGETPVAPADPTRPETAAATYTFTGWNPTVGPISKNTEYIAQYEATPKDYTVTILVSPEGAGTVGTSQVTVPYGSPIGSYNNELFVADYTIVATAGSGYVFSNWGTLPATVTEDLTVTATFESAGSTVTVSATGYGQVILDGGTPANSVTISGVPSGTPIYTFGPILSIGGHEVTLSPEQDYYFNGWGDQTSGSWASLPDTVTQNLLLVVEFTSFEQKNTIYSDTLGSIVHYPQQGTIVITYHGTDPNITQNTVTMGDRNLWAKEYFGQTADNLVLSSGKIFQWGNNNPFEYGNVPLNMIHNSKVSVAGYVNHPSEFSTDQFYNNEVTDYGDNQYDDDGNIYNIQNLWGDYTDTDVARKGPCPNGWHLPSAEECNNLSLILQEFSNIGFQNNNPFLMPLDNDGDLVTIDIDGRASSRNDLWTSDFVNDPEGNEESGYNVDPMFGEAEYVRSAYLGLQVRPFKNSSPL